MLPLPQNFPGRSGVGVLSGGDTVKTRTNPCTQWGTGCAAQTGLYLEYGAKPSSSPQFPFMSSQSCSGWGTHRRPNPPTAPFCPSTALGDAGGHPVLPIPCSQHPRVPRGRPMGTTTSESLVAPVSLMSLSCPWCPCSSPPWDFSSTMRCQDACGVLPAPIKATDGRHPCQPQQYPSPATGWWPLSEPTSWRQVPWG